MMRPTLYDQEAVKRFLADRRIEPDLMRRVKYAMLQNCETVEQALSRLISADRVALHDTFDIEPLAEVSAVASSIDRSIKFVLATRDGKRLETVLIRTSGERAMEARTTVCVSTQIGCQAGCPFCATSRMGLVRNLSADEIVEQVRMMGERAAREGDRIRNIVFMGMGEPLHNEAALHGALQLLTCQREFNIPHRRITVSTVGDPAAMRRLVERFPGVRLALSLHATSESQRRRIVPWSRQYSWSELWSAVQDITSPSDTRRFATLMIEYILIAGVNDSTDDARELTALLNGLDVVVNLIPYNPITFAAHWQPTSREHREVFGQILRSAGIKTTIRYSMGHDIQAACGQLIVIE